MLFAVGILLSLTFDQGCGDFLRSNGRGRHRAQQHYYGLWNNPNTSGSTNTRTTAADTDRYQQYDGDDDEAYYDDYDWSELPSDVRYAAKYLGCDQYSWDHGLSIELDDYWWSELTPQQQNAAGILRYTQLKWDCTDNNDDVPDDSQIEENEIKKRANSSNNDNNINRMKASKVEYGKSENVNNINNRKYFENEVTENSMGNITKRASSVDENNLNAGSRIVNNSKFGSSDMYTKKPLKEVGPNAVEEMVTVMDKATESNSENFSTTQTISGSTGLGLTNGRSEIANPEEITRKPIANTNTDSKQQQQPQELQQQREEIIQEGSSFFEFFMITFISIFTSLFVLKLIEPYMASDEVVLIR